MARKKTPGVAHPSNSVEGESVQDDKREKLLRALYGLVKPAGAGRIGTDAVLEFPEAGMIIEFELKSATRKGISTARDVGPGHRRKWKNRHWLVGFFDPKGQSLEKCLYASPKDLEPWIAAQEAKVKLDFDFAAIPAKLNPQVFEELLQAHFGDKKVYSLADARRIQKKQYTAERYQELMDRDKGYSRERMLQILADRWVYVTKRGATLNNPHIGSGHYSGYRELVIAPQDEARRSLRLAVRESLAAAVDASSPTE